MKNKILNKIILAITMIFGLISCDDREIITVENGNAPMVMDLSKQSLFLDVNFPDNAAITISWSAAGYSVPVEAKYRIEASKDDKFTTPNVIGTVNGSQKTASFTASQMNSASEAIGLAPFVAGKMYLRVVSFLGTSDLLSTSNVTTLTVTPYKLTYPDFFLVGAASYVDWTAGSAQILYKVDNIMTIYTYLEKGKTFRFLGQKAWDPINYSINADGIKDAYKYFNQVSDNIAKAPGSNENENMIFNGDTGIYKLVIDAKKEVKSLKATASPIPGYDFTQIYLVGNVAGNGWSAENAVDMTKTGAGVFEYVTKLPADAEFKFLGQKSFGALDWGNISSSGNTGFLGPKGDNGNIKFVGDGGNYKITVNVKAGIYTIVKQ